MAGRSNELLACLAVTEHFPYFLCLCLAKALLKRLNNSARGGDDGGYLHAPTHERPRASVCAFYHAVCNSILGRKEKNYILGEKR
jgi:hypothetical protein